MKKKRSRDSSVKCWTCKTHWTVGHYTVRTCVVGHYTIRKCVVAHLWVTTRLGNVCVLLPFHGKPVHRVPTVMEMHGKILSGKMGKQNSRGN